MKEIFLREDYVRILHKDKPSYGSNQIWFSEENGFFRAGIIAKWGCGCIAVADVWQYLAESDRRFQTPVTALAGKTSDVFSWDTYRNYISYINLRYVPLLNGTHGVVLASAMQRYAARFRLPLRAAWKGFMNDRQMLNGIRKMLSEDIPVILSVGPNMPIPFTHHGIPFYNRKERPGKDPIFVPSLNKCVHAHFITVTGMVVVSPKRVMLRVSSWGEEFYMDYAEYREYIRKYGDRFTSSMLYMEKK